MIGGGIRNLYLPILNSASVEYAELFEHMFERRSMNQQSKTVLAVAPLHDTHLSSLLYARTSVQAGFPSPAQDYFEGSIDLNAHLVADATSTFIVRVAGDSMAGVGISNGDEVIVDRSLTPRDGNVVIAVIDGELTIKRLIIKQGRVILRAENPAYPDISIASQSDLTVWGVVTRCLHHV